jgi:serine phosphatase RsbU (regulator of sigma subunit)
MEAQVAVAKVGKYATSESGDTLEMTERPGGGLSFVLVDGQRSGKPAKKISNIVARKAISLLAEGVRDGAAARAASDYLYTHRSGQVSATLNILSIDLVSGTLVITRNNPTPAILIRAGEAGLIEDEAKPVGTHMDIRPAIREVPLSEDICVVLFTDGLAVAGDRAGTPMDILAEIASLQDEEDVDPAVWAKHLLNRAVELDDGRPADDISVLVAATLPKTGDETRELLARMPINP